MLDLRERMGSRSVSSLPYETHSAGKEGNSSPNKKTDSLSYSARRLASRFRELLTSG